MNADIKLLMLNSHWTAADAIYATRNAPIPGEEKAAAEYGEEMAELARYVSSFYRMLVFYALVYVVVEAYQELDEELRSTELDAIISKGPLDKLRRLRNAVFHVQDEPLNPKLWDFLHEADSEKWIYEVHRGFWPYFQKRMNVKNRLAELRGQIETAPQADAES